MGRDMMAYLLAKSLHLLGLQASVGEHANLYVTLVLDNFRVLNGRLYLARNVRPVMLAAESLEVLPQQSAHADDAVRHALDLTLPLLVQGRVVEDGGRDAGAVDRRVRIQWPNQDLDLRLDTLLLLGRSSDNREGTAAFSVQTLNSSAVNNISSRIASTNHVLGKALAQSNVMTLLDKVPRSKRIPVSIARGKALVGHIEKGKVALLLDHIADLAPLLLRRVDTSWVVRTGMQQDDAVVGRVLEVLDQAGKVQADRVLVIVPVGADLQTGALEHGIVVGPTRSRQVDLLGVRVEARQELTPYPQRTRARDRLRDHQPVLLDDGRVFAVRQLRGGLGERRQTRDSRVLLVQLRRDDLLLSGADRWQHIRLALVIT